MLFKNIIAQIRYNYNDNYKNYLILNLGVKKIARHSKIILNLYKKTKNNETSTDKNQCEKKQRTQKIRNTEFINIGRSLYFHNVYPITERHMYMVNKLSFFQSDFRLDSSYINKYHLSSRSFKPLPKNCLIKWVAIKKK